MIPILGISTDFLSPTVVDEVTVGFASALMKIDCDVGILVDREVEDGGLIWGRNKLFEMEVGKANVPFSILLVSDSRSASLRTTL